MMAVDSCFPSLWSWKYLWKTEAKHLHFSRAAFSAHSSERGREREVEGEREREGEREKERGQVYKSDM